MEERKTFFLFPEKFVSFTFSLVWNNGPQLKADIAHLKHSDV